MNTKRTVKVIKRQEPNDLEHQGGAKSASGSNIWSTTVRLWVSQYRQARAEGLPAFGRLFKDEVSQPVECPVSVTRNLDSVS
jgi:hypothetical protein